MGRYCLVPGCKSGCDRLKKGITVHSVPNDVRLAREWMLAAKRENVVNVKNTGVCSLHFLPEDYLRDIQFELANPGRDPVTNPKRKLKEDAIPSQNIPKCPPKSHRHAGALAAQTERRDILQSVVMDQPPMEREPSPAPGPASSCSHPEELAQLRQKVTDLEATIRRLSDQLEAKDAEVKALYRDKLRVFLTDQQIDALLESKRPCPWDEQTIHRALVFRTRLSRSQYNFLRDGGMPLPSLTTLKTRLRKVTITQEDSGFARTILKAYLEEKPDRERPCVLMFDEMKVRDIGDYDSTDDQIIGPVNYLQQVMVRSIVGSWKMPLFFACDTRITKDLLNKLVVDAEACGLRVMAIVSDLGGSNRGLWTSLDVSHDGNTHFTNPADSRRNIWVFADTPHLYKLLRNHLLDNGLQLPGGGLVDKQLFADVLAIDRGKEFRILPKLGMESHVQVTGQARQKVRPAAQLLSASVAAAVDTFLGREEEARYLRAFDSGFDALNGQCPTDVKPLRRGIKGDGSAHFRALAELEAAIRLKFQGKTSLLPFQKGFIVTIRSMRGLAADLLPVLGQGSYVLPGRINQDILESFFSLVRGKGGANLHPSPSEAKCRIRSLSLMFALRLGVNPLTLNPMSPEPVTGGDSAVETALLSEDLEEHHTEDSQLSSDLMEIESLVEAARQSRPAPSGTATASPVDPRTSVTAEQYGMAYAAGYLSAKCRKIDPSLGTPSAYADETAMAETMWIRMRSMGGLSVPSGKWMEQFKVLDSAFCVRHHLEPDRLSRSTRVVESLVESITNQNLDLPDIRIVRMFVRLRTFLRLSTVNRMLRKSSSTASLREKTKNKQFAT